MLKLYIRKIKLRTNILDSTLSLTLWQNSVSLFMDIILSHRCHQFSVITLLWISREWTISKKSKIRMTFISQIHIDKLTVRSNYKHVDSNRKLTYTNASFPRICIKETRFRVRSISQSDIDRTFLLSFEKSCFIYKLVTTWNYKHI